MSYLNVGKSHTYFITLCHWSDTLEILKILLGHWYLSPINLSEWSYLPKSSDSQCTLSRAGPSDSPRQCWKWEYLGLPASPLRAMKSKTAGWRGQWHFGFCFILFFCFFLLMAASAAHGRSQARGQIRAAAAGHIHSHSNMGSEPHLWPMPQPVAMLDP